MRNISGQDKPAFKYRLIQFPCVFNMFFFFFKRNYISEEHHGTWYKKYTETPGKIKNELSGILNHSRGPFCIANNVIAYCYIYIYIYCTGMVIALWHLKIIHILNKKNKLIAFLKHSINHLFMCKLS